MKVNVFVSVTYSKPLEVEVKEGYTDVDLTNAVKDMQVLPNDILLNERRRLRKLLKVNDAIFDEDFKHKLIIKRENCKPWHEDELVVMEDVLSPEIWQEG